MDIYNTIRRPLVTEKGTHQSQFEFAATRTMPARGGSFAFEVHPDATKAVVREAIEKMYNVKVLDVRTSNRRGKSRRVRYKTGKTRRWKKAVVTLREGYHIDLF